MKSGQNSTKSLLRTSKLVALTLLSVIPLVSQTKASASPARLPISSQTLGEGKIAFDSMRTGSHELYIMNADGTAQTRLTNTGYNTEPSLLADGTKIAFVSNRGTANNTEIYSMNADGTNVIRLTDSPNVDASPTWSADGSKIAFISYRDGNAEIYVMNADGTNQTRLTNNTFVDMDPTWSPDGTQLLFASYRGNGYLMYIMNVDGTGQRIFLPDTIGSAWYPAWSPDGTKIAFYSNSEIYTVDISGNNLKQLTNNNDVDAWPTWSPDSKKIAFTTDRVGNDYRIFVMNADGTNQVPLTTVGSTSNNASWGYGSLESNGKPTAYDQLRHLQEDEFIDFTLTGNDPAGAPLTYSITSDPVYGTITGVAPNLKYTPKPNYDGWDYLYFKVNNGTKDSNVAKISFYITFVNDIPTISSISNQVIDEDNSTDTLDFIIADDTAKPQNLAVTASSSNPTLFPEGSIVLGGSGANRTIKLTPSLNGYGTADITVKVSERDDLVVTQTFKVIVNPVDDTPTISTVGNQSLDEDTPTGILPFTINDADVLPENLTVTATSDNAALFPSGSLLLGGTGANRTIRLAPATNQNGSANITIEVKDSGNLSAKTTFKATVLPVNDAPTISAISNQTIKEDTALLSLNFLVQDAETASSNLSVSVSNSNTALFSGSGVALSTTGASGAQRTLTLRPIANAFGTTKITLRVSDGNLTTTSIFDVTVESVNDAPTISTVGNQALNEDNSTGNLGFTINDIDSLPANLTVTATSDNAVLFPNGSLLLGGTGASRTIRLIPAANKNGSANITIQVKDNGNLTAKTIFKATVLPVNDAPTLSAITNKTINEDATPLNIGFIVEDLDTPAANIVVTAKSLNQSIFNVNSLVLSGQGMQRTLTVKPLPNANGTATIIVRATDGAGGIVEKSFAIIVKPINDAPTISLINNQSIKEGVATSTLPFTIGDVETAVGSLAVTATSSNTKLFPATNMVLGGNTANRSIKLTPAALQSGNATITVQVKDSEGLITKSTFTVTVTKAS